MKALSAQYGQWKTLTAKVRKSVVKVLSMRKWQKDFFKWAKGKSLMILDAPMGAGKSFAVALVSAYRLMKDPTLKVLIAVPQTIIGKSFERQMWFDFLTFPWEPIHSDKSTKALIAWLNSPVGSLNGRVRIISHSMLLKIYKHLDNTLVWIDEAHHSMNDDDENNHLGKVVNWILKRDDISLGLITATFFRGDHKEIITKSQKKRFKEYKLSWVEHLSSMHYLSEFQYDFLFSPDYVKAIKSLFSRRVGKTIIYLPMGKTRAETQALLRAIKRALPSHLKVIDLVYGKDKKEFYKIEKRSDADVILALNMMKEGADWRWADRAIILGIRNSFTELIQTIGRLFRDVIGKRRVEVKHVLPFECGDTDNVNDFLVSAFGAMMAGAMLIPTKIKNHKKASIHSRKMIKRIAKHVLEQRLNGLKVDGLDFDLIERQQIIDDILVMTTDVFGIDTLQELGDTILRYSFLPFEEARRFVWSLELQNTAAWRDIKSSLPDNIPTHPGEVYAEEFISYQNWIGCEILPFEEAREIVREMNFRHLRKYREWHRENKPKNLPLYPETKYGKERMKHGPVNPYYSEKWINIADFLDSEDAIQAQQRKYRSFENARAFVRKQGLKNMLDWHAWAGSDKRPKDIPYAAQSVYKNEWVNMGDWLGTGNIAPQSKKFKSFNQARKFARSLKLSSIPRRAAWYAWHTKNKPADLPYSAQKKYKGKFKGWADFLGY